MFIFFLLKQVVVVAAQREVAVVLVRAVIADLLGSGAKGFFVFGKELGVLDLLVFVERDYVIGFCEVLFEFMNAGS